MSDLPSSSSAVADDFIHIAIDKSTNSSLSDSFNSRSQYCQVIFNDLSEVYPTDGDIQFSFSFQPGVTSQIGDRIALYKIGWSSVSEYVTSVYAKAQDDPAQNKPMKITFPVENLPKDEVNMYQFCYITSGNIVAGSSIPFTFRKPHESELVAMEDPTDPGLVVFRSRVTQLQEQLIETVAVKESIEQTNNELKSELYLKNAELTEKNQRCQLHKSNIDDMTKVIYNLNSEKKELLELIDAREKEVNELKVGNEALSTEKDKLKKLAGYQVDQMISADSIIDGLKSEVKKKEENIESLRKALNSSEESLKSNSATLEIQLIQANENISTFKSNMDQMEKSYEEKLKTLKTNLEDRNDCFTQFTKSMDEREMTLKEELETLKKKRNTMSERLNACAAENLTLSKDLENAYAQIKVLEEAVTSRDRILNARLESDDNSVSRALVLSEDEKSLLQVQLMSLEERLRCCEAECSRMGMENQQLREEKISMADQMSRMNAELRYIKNGGAQPQPGVNFHAETNPQGSAHVRVEHQMGGHFQAQAGPHCQAGAQFHAGPQTHTGAPPHFRANAQRHAFRGAQWQSDPSAPPPPHYPHHQKVSFPWTLPFFNQLHSFNSTANVNSACGEPSQKPPPTPQNPKCEKCQELDAKVKLLLTEKADIRSHLIQSRHSNEEYCKSLKEVNEEAAALRSRIAVLEIELRKAKEVSITTQGEQKFKEMYGALSTSWNKSEDPANTGLESGMSLKAEELLRKERETKVLLQRNVESLMLSDAKNFATIDKLMKENSKLSAEITQVKECQSTVDEMRQALDDLDRSKEDLTKTLGSVQSEKSRLEIQLFELRKEAVGKVSLSNAQQLRDEIETLKQQLQDKECCKKLREKFEAAGLNVGRFAQAHQLDTSNMPPVTSSVGTAAIVCPLCFLTFPPDTIEEFNKHFSDHLD